MGTIVLTYKLSMVSPHIHLRRYIPYTVVATVGSLGLFWLAKVDVDRKRGDMVKIQKKMVDQQYQPDEEVKSAADLLSVTTSAGFEDRLKQAEAAR